MSNEAVYNRIAMLRAERKVSRRELADALGVHYQTVGYLERGEYSPSLYLALRIAAYFEVPVEVIFSTEPFPRLGSASAESASAASVRRLEVVPVRRAVAVEPVVGPLGVLAPAGVGVLAALLGQDRRRQPPPGRRSRGAARARARGLAWPASGDVTLPPAVARRRESRRALPPAYRRVSPPARVRRPSPSRRRRLYADRAGARERMHVPNLLARSVNDNVLGTHV